MALSFPYQNIHQIPCLSSFTRTPFTQSSLVTANGKDLSVARNISILQPKEKLQETRTIDMKNIINFVHDMSPRIFDEPKLVTELYDDCMRYSDPVISIGSLHKFSRYIKIIKRLCQSDAQLHYVKQTGPYEITTRWTCVMKFVLLPWKPNLVFTGTSVMTINPDSQKICNHVDLWDSIKNNDCFSPEGFVDFLQQMLFYRNPDLEPPKYQILKRTADYEVRRYSSFVVAETEGEKILGSNGFNNVLSQETARLRKVEGGIAAVSKFSENVTATVVCTKQRTLRSALLKDGLNPKQGYFLATCNDLSPLWNFIMRNELLIWLQDFVLE